MGALGSKSPLERRNTVLRRSQRKSIHGVKSKTEKLIKDIRKFKGTEENTDYIELKARIESLERELRSHTKILQPQIKNIYQETLKKTEECHKLLSDKLKENQDKAKETTEETKETKVEDDEDDDVFVEDVTEEERKLEESTEKRKTVELKLIQVEPIESSPQVNKRFSAIKVGVPVLPGSLMESLHKKNEEVNAKAEVRVAAIRQEIENLEMEISQFVGRKNGKYYNKIKETLDRFGDELSTISSTDDDIEEHVKLCRNYIGSCLSFLNEKAVDGDGDDDEVGEVQPSPEPVVESNLSPRSIRTTYI